MIDAVFKIKSHISVFFKNFLNVNGLLKIGIILKKIINFMYKDIFKYI